MGDANSEHAAREDFDFTASQRRSGKEAVRSIEHRLAYTRERRPRRGFTSTLASADVDDTKNIESAVRAISGNYCNGEDVLELHQSETVSAVLERHERRTTLTVRHGWPSYENGFAQHYLLPTPAGQSLGRHADGLSFTGQRMADCEFQKPQTRDIDFHGRQ